MSRVISNPRQPADDLGDARQGPKIRAEAVSRSTLTQRRFDRFHLAGVQSGSAAGSPGRAERCDAAASPLAVPAAHALPADLKPVCDVRLMKAVGEQVGGLLATALKTEEVPAGTEGDVHADSMTDRSASVTVLCEIQ